MPPGFVKTARDEARWEKAKAAAQKSYPGLEGDRFYAAANAIFHGMKSGTRTERVGNPGKEQRVEQFPIHGDKPDPFDHMEPFWQPNDDSVQKAQERYYDAKGNRKPIERRVPLGPGGDGQTIGRLSESCLAKGGKR